MKAYFIDENRLSFVLSTKTTYERKMGPANHTATEPCSGYYDNVYYGSQFFEEVKENCYLTHILEIKDAIEITFACSFVLIGIAFALLQRFIQEYAFSLVDRMSHVKKLTKINTDLKSKVKAQVVEGKIND